MTCWIRSAVRVPALRGVEVAGDRVEDADEARGEALGPCEAEGAAALDALLHQPDARPGGRTGTGRSPQRNAPMHSSRSAPRSSAMRYASAHSSFARSNWPSTSDASPAVIRAPARPTVGAPPTSASRKAAAYSRAVRFFPRMCQYSHRSPHSCRPSSEARRRRPSPRRGACRARPGGCPPRRRRVRGSRSARCPRCRRGCHGRARHTG